MREPPRSLRPCRFRSLSWSHGSRNLPGDVEELVSESKTDDQRMGDFVYCRAHLRVHSTGWCTVDVSDKVPLRSSTLRGAELEYSERMPWLWASLPGLHANKTLSWSRNSPDCDEPDFDCDHRRIYHIWAMEMPDERLWPWLTSERRPEPRKP